MSDTKQENSNGKKLSKIDDKLRNAGQFAASHLCAAIWGILSFGLYVAITDDGRPDYTFQNPEGEIVKFWEKRDGGYKFTVETNENKVHYIAEGPGGIDRVKIGTFDIDYNVPEWFWYDEVAPEIILSANEIIPKYFNEMTNHQEKIALQGEVPTKSEGIVAILEAVSPDRLK